MKVIVAPSARADLNSLAEFIAARSVERAIAVVDRIARQYSKLAIFPNRGRPRPEFGVGIRSLSVRPYMVFYRVLDNGSIVVGRIIDGRRDMQTPLFF